MAVIYGVSEILYGTFPKTEKIFRRSLRCRFVVKYLSKSVRGMTPMIKGVSTNIGQRNTCRISFYIS